MQKFHPVILYTLIVIVVDVLCSIPVDVDQVERESFDLPLIHEPVLPIKNSN
jgi:hypothetical protein